MKLKYIITAISGPNVNGRWIATIKKDADSKRRIELLAEVAKEYVERGWLVLDGSAPPAPIDEVEAGPEYDFKGSTVRDARPPINRYSADHTLSDPEQGSDKGALIIVEATGLVTITLPKDWSEGDGSVIRRAGTGAVKWALQAGATSALPASRSGHVGIAETNSEIMVRVVKNVDGKSAVWSIEGATA